MAKPRLPRLENWTPLATAEAVFSAEECAAILALRGADKSAEIEAGGEIGPAPYRDSRVSWIRPEPDTEWIFKRTMDFVAQANSTSYQMELAGFTEPLQLAEYGPGQFYDWHLDFGNGRFSIRKLSFIVQLTDPADYEGGSVELLCAREPVAATTAQGAAVAFPSYLLHRVNAVTSGVRHSLVGWIGGPPFR